MLAIGLAGALAATGAMAQTTGNPRQDRSLFCLKPSAPRRSIAVSPVRRPIRTLGPVPAAKHILIDALRSKTVTR